MRPFFQNYLINRKPIKIVIFDFMKRKVFFGFIIFCLGWMFFSGSCKNDLDINAPYRESVAVYALISTSDTVNYVRVNRVFLGEGDATQIAQIQDSAYFKPGEVTVYVEKYYNGQKKQTIPFSETFVQLSPGVFNTNQLIYRSTFKFKADTNVTSANIVDFQYKLVVKNNVTGKIFTATTKLVRSIRGCPGSLPGCFFRELPLPAYNVNIPVNGNANVVIGSVVNAKVYNFSYRFYWRDSLFDGTIIPRSLDFTLGTRISNGISGGENIDFSYPGSIFYSTIRDKVPDDSNVMKRLADSISFYFDLGGEEFYWYNEINGTSGSFGQEKPIYTNIDNGGVGFFTGKYRYVFTRKFFNFSDFSQQDSVMSQLTVQNLMQNCKTICKRFKGPGWATNTGGSCCY